MDDLTEDKEEQPIDIKCSECGDIFLGWEHQKGEACMDCYAVNYFEGND